MSPTLLGLFPVLVWGIAVPVFRLAQAQIGMLGTMGALFFGTGLLSALNQYVRLKAWPKPRVFKNPLFYARWICFVMHEGLFFTGVSIVQKAHVPFVILLNYLWPTAIIVCSVLIAGVKVTRWWAFMAGSCVVITSLAIEVLGPEGFSPSLFASKTDCVAYAIILIGAVSWGFYSALSRRGGDAAGGSATTPLYQLTLGLALPFSFMHLSFLGAATWDHATLSGFALLGGYCCVQFLAYLLWDYSVRHGSIVILSLMSDFIPWLSLTTAGLLLGVDIGQKTVVSAVTLVAGAMITRHGTLAKKTKITEDRMD